MKGKGVLFFIAVILFVLIVVPSVMAGPNEARDLVAPYGHFPAAVGSATGPFTTHYLVSNTTFNSTTVNVKCYDDGEDRVGPAAGTTISLGAFDMDVYSPISLGLTTDPFFSGYGWCYFAVTSGDDVAVTFIAGISVNNNLITTNNSLLMMADTAQSMVTDGDANIPYWTKEGSWNTYLLPINPTTTNRNITMHVYNASGGLLGTWTGLLGGLGPRDLDFVSIPDAVGASGYGNADITMSGRGFVGWVAGVNYTSFQGFIYPVPMDKDDVSLLAVGDRP